MFDELFPILSTPDLARALGFYRDLLDGEVRMATVLDPDGNRVIVASRAAEPPAASRAAAEPPAAGPPDS